MATQGDLRICPFSGNSDLYGIGIRTGFYLQWISTLLATLFTPSQEDVLRIVNLLIQTAVFIGMVVLTVEEEIRPVEPIITIWLIFGALSSLSGSGLNPVGRLSGVFRVLLYSAVAGYASWFWFVGLDGILERHSECDTIAFFGATSVRGLFRTFNKVAAIFGVCICAFFLVWNAMAVIKRLNGQRHASPARRRPKVQIELLFLSSVIIIISIAAIEHLLDANQVKIDDVASVGQLLPLSAGIFGLTEVLWSVLRKRLWRRPRCWVLFTKHFS